MPIRLAILGLLLAVGPMVSGEPNGPADHKQQPGPQGQPAVAAADSSATHASNEKDQSKADPNPPKWYTPFKLPDWWLVIIAAITGGVVAWQSRETRRAAKAALLNAKAIIGAERAWIVVGDVKGKPWHNYQTGSDQVNVSIYFINKGRTPAFLLEGDCKSVFCLGGISLPVVSDLDSKPSKEIDRRSGVCIQPKGEYCIRNVNGSIVIPDTQRLYGKRSKFPS